MDTLVELNTCEIAFSAKQMLKRNRVILEAPMTRYSLLFTVLLLAIVSPLRLSAGPSPAHTSGHRMLSEEEIVWSDGPASLPAGGKMAVLYGDPGKGGLFILRAKFPANYKI